MSTVTWSTLIVVVPLLSKRSAPLSLPQQPGAMTLGEPAHGKGKMEPAGRRPSA